jgi:hypothetical protein
MECRDLQADDQMQSLSTLDGFRWVPELSASAICFLRRIGLKNGKAAPVDEAA